MLWRKPIERENEGFRLHLSPDERGLVRGLAAELDALLVSDEDDEGVARLFPDAYEDDDDAAAEYRRLVASELREARRGAVRVLRDTVARETLSEDEVTAWLGVLNDLRLVLGTRLGVTEELYERDLADDDPRAPEVAVFLYLTWLEERTVEALQGR